MWYGRPTTRATRPASCTLDPPFRRCSFRNCRSYRRTIFVFRASSPSLGCRCARDNSGSRLCRSDLVGSRYCRYRFRCAAASANAQTNLRILVVIPALRRVGARSFRTRNARCADAARTGRLASWAKAKKKSTGSRRSDAVSRVELLTWRI